MGEGKMKVTDKRMFTPEGELKEEYRDLLERTPEGSEGAAETAEEGARAPASEPAAGPDAGPGGAATEERGRVEIPRTPGALGTPGFFDLVNMLAQPVLIYLGEARGPDGQSMEDLELARLHIDFLDVLRRKTAGNLSAQESQALEDLIYQLRMRYVEKRG